MCSHVATHYISTQCDMTLAFSPTFMLSSRPDLNSYFHNNKAVAESWLDWNTVLCITVHLPRNINTHVDGTVQSETVNMACEMSQFGIIRIMTL